MAVFAEVMFQGSYYVTNVVVFIKQQIKILFINFYDDFLRLYCSYVRIIFLLML
ncbi:hypothetical protein [Candidatus Ichthyocystis hellenicum]|uniref:hypothetical protein n=1 Tax=Candidatus Ichthyocystis hellenicum TaxID=1561003 RepID=UPI00155EE1BB|nr:hypothetical protein [Candidatus Ichthyocystis hellenicum]